MQFKKIKKKSKTLLKKHFFRNIIITFISLLIINGGYSYVTQTTSKNTNDKVIKEVKKINKNGKSNADLVDDIINTNKKDIKNKKEEVHNKTKDVTSLIVNELTKSKSFFLGV